MRSLVKEKYLLLCHTSNQDIGFTSFVAVGRFMWCLPAEEQNTGNKCKVTVKDFHSKSEALQEITSTRLLRVTEGVFFPNEKYFQQHGAVIHSQGPHFCWE